MTGERPTSPGPAAIGLRARALLVSCALFVGVGALYGGIRLLSDAEGFGMEASWLDGTPFSDYTVPGLVLLVAVGGGMLVTAALALARSHRAPVAALVAGALLLGFLVVETVAIGYQGPAQLVLVVAVGLAGLVVLGVGLRTARR